MTRMTDIELLLIGAGPDERKLKALAAELGVHTRVRFLGARPQSELASFYGAADALVLASSSEGWPNVLLESMACGTPVVATNVCGVGEIVSVPEAGVLAGARTPEAIAQAVERLFAQYPERAATRRYAERFSWDETTRGQLALFGRILGDTSEAHALHADASVEA